MELLGDIMDTSDSNKKEIIVFPSWIKKRNPKTADKILSSFNVLNLMLMKNKAIRSGILQITDIEEIESLISRIRSNEVINLHSGNKKNAYLSALSEYRDYLQCLQEEREEASNENISEKMIAKPDSDVIDEKTESEADGPLIVSVVNEQDYSYTRPQSLECFETRYDMRNWTQVYVQLVK